MKTLNLLSFLLLITVVKLQAQTSVSGGNTKQTPVPAPSAYRIVDQGANHNVWRRETYEAGPKGEVITHEHQYTELASGLNFFDSNNQQWLASKEEIDILPQGGASATQGQHQAYFPGDIYNGVIELVTAEGLHLKSRPVGLSYDDGTNSILIAQLTNSVGYLVSSNQIIYPDAFVGVSADLRYTYTKAGFEQDVILKEQPPTPGSLGLNADSTRLQVLTEFFNPPKPTVTTTLSRTDIGEVTDDQLNFGGMRMGRGKAFLLGTDPSGVMVNKQWVQIQGRQILVEEVPTASIAKDLEALPLSKFQVTSLGKTHPLASRLILPAQHLAKAGTVTMQLARNDSMNHAGLVLDYQTIGSSLTNYTFRGDLTYYISGTTHLYGTNTIEGGTVIKYAASASLNLSSATTLRTASYRPAIFTAKDDNSIGEPVSGSSGSPSGYYANPALNNIAGQTLSNIRIKYAQIGLEGYGNVNDAQFFSCQQGLTIATSYVGWNIQNVLFANVQTNFNSLVYIAYFNAQNITVSGSSTVIAGPSSGVGVTLAATNSIFANITSLTNNYIYSVSGSYNGFYSSPQFGDSAIAASTYPFQVVGGGSYYLTNGCGFQNAGTTTISSSLLTDLATKTTYPPIVYSNTTISVATTFNPQAQRDTDTPDLGYHYDPIDYAVGGLDLYAALTVNAGTAIGWFDHTGPVYSGQPYGMSLNDGASLTFLGTATQPCWMSRFDMAQENSAGWPWRGWMGGVMFNGTSVTPQLNAKFTKWSLPANNNNHFRDNWAYGMGTLSDCEFYYGSFGGYKIPSLTFTNCLFYRDALYFYDQRLAINFDFQNCTFYNGFFEAARYSYDAASQWVVHDTVFDGTGFSLDDNFAGNPSYTSFDYNAYNTNNLAGLSYPYPYTPQPTNVLEDIGAHDLFVGGFNWQSSWFGDFYLPTNSPLVNAGSTTADQVGLYHFTTQANQIPETNSPVDIGYHYVALGLDSEGLLAYWPLDETTGSTADDVSGQNNNGTLYNGPIWTDGILGGALNFDGVDDYAEVPNSASLQTIGQDGSDFSVSFWIYLEADATGNWRNLFHKGNSDTDRTFGIWMNTSDNRILYVVSTTANWNEYTFSIAEVPLNQWTYVTYVKEGSQLQLYLNGVLDSQLTLAGTSVANTGPLYVGKDPWYTGTACKLDDIRIYNRALSESEITSLAVGTSNPIDSNGDGIPDYLEDANGNGVDDANETPWDWPVNNLILWLRADQGVSSLSGYVNDWADQSGHGNDATQSSSGNQPVYVTGALNGLPVIQFNPANGTGLNISGNLFNSTTSSEAFVVLKVAQALPSSQRALWKFGTYGSSYPNTDGTIIDSFTSGSLNSVGYAAQPLTQYHVFETASQNGLWEAWINGELQTLLKLNSYNPSSIYGWSLGYDNQAYNYFDGDIAEVLVFNRMLSANERININNYLNVKYALTTLPLAPTNLIATAISSNQISLIWNFNLGTSSTIFEIDRGTSSNGVFTVVADVQDALSYLDTNLTAGTTYYYKILAKNGSGHSTYSNVASATPINGANMPISSLLLWLKADSDVVRENSGSVSDWFDQSGENNNASQTSSGNQPLYITNVLNGLPVIRFSPANGTGFNLPTILNSATGSEAFVVLKVAQALPSSQRALWKFGFYGSSYPDTSGNINDSFASTSVNAAGNPVQPLTQYHVFETASQDGLWETWINGELQAIFTNNTFYSSPPYGLTLGYDNQVNNYFDGDIAEVLVFNRLLTVDERDTLGTYLFSKYGLSLYATNNVGLVAPTNLIASGIAPYQLNLQWNIISNNASSFHLERELGIGGFQEIAAFSSYVTNFLDTTALPTNTYYYRIGSHNWITNNSLYSATISPPTVNITNLPSVILENETNQVIVQAADADGTVNNIQLFAGYHLNGLLIGTSSSSPYTFKWIPTIASSFVLTTLATDNQGNSQYSSPVYLITYLDANGDGIPDIFEVQNGNDPMNPWIVPSGDSNTNPPNINLIVPASTTLVH